MSAMPSVRNLALAVAFAALVTLPYWMPGIYYINVSSQVLFYAIFALGLNILVGYGGLVSLGHAGLFGITAYAIAYLLSMGLGPHRGDPRRARHQPGLHRRVRGAGAARDRHRLHHDHAGARPDHLGSRLSLDQPHRRRQRHQRAKPGRRRSASISATPNGFYYTTLVIFLVAVVVVAIFVRSPFGAALKGTRDQPRRMNALGYHVWAIRFWACLLSGLLTAVAGILFVYYTQFISPQTTSLTASAEVLLMVIAGRARDAARADRWRGAGRRRQERGDAATSSAGISCSARSSSPSSS